ncbi:MAG: hypothetical protein K2M95_01940 [Clostridiales bacterium]|nr:hypothetical protein [Clostridiales bacterium]
MVYNYGMDWITQAVIIFTVTVVTPTILTLLYRTKTKEERKYAPDGTRTKMPRYIFVSLGTFFGILFVLLALVMIGAAIDREFEVVAAIGICEVLFAVCAWVMLTYLHLRYETAEEDGIVLVRRFGKKRKKIYYKDVTYYSYVEGYTGGLVAYDAFARPLFRISGFTVGVNLIAQKLKEMNVTQVPAPKVGNFSGTVYRPAFTPAFPSERIKATPEYKTFRKKQKYTGIFAIFYLVGGMAALFCLVFIALVASSPTFENYVVEGTVESYEYESATLTIKLKDDESVYYVNSLIYGVLDTSLKNTSLSKRDIVLHVGYTDDYGRKNVSHIEFAGKTYLHERDAEQAERRNYDTSKTAIWVCGVFGGICLLIGTVFVILRVETKLPADGNHPNE